MTNARIDRMLRELNSEPPVQLFQNLFGLVGLGEPREEQLCEPLPTVQTSAA